MALPRKKIVRGSMPAPVRAGSGQRASGAQHDSVGCKPSGVPSFSRSGRRPATSRRPPPPPGDRDPVLAVAPVPASAPDCFSRASH